MSEVLTFRSPLAVDEVRSRIKGTCLYRSLGFWRFFQGNPAELFGHVRGRRVRLQAPSLLNNREPTLVGTLENVADGGTVLRAHFQMSFGSLTRSAAYNAQQRDRIVEAISRISGLVLVDAETI